MKLNTFIDQQWIKLKLTIADLRQSQIILSQTLFGPISINSSIIFTVLIATRSPWKDFSINTSYILGQLILAEISGKSIGNYHGTIY